MIYDVVIIGGGPGGYTAAISAARRGLNVALIEGRKLGGVCLNEGCIPTKSLLYASKIYKQTISSQNLGIKVENARFDLVTAIKRKNDVVNKLSKGLAAQLNSSRIQIFNQFGYILSRTEYAFEVKLEDSSIIKGKRLIIATGTTELYPSIKGVKESIENNFVMGSKELLDNIIPIEKIVIIGCGVIGLECASYLTNMGCEVTIVDHENDVIRGLDREVCKVLINSLTSKGIKFKLGVKVECINELGRVEIAYGDTHESLQTDKVLIATGRKANIHGLGLENLNIEVKNGYIATDEYCRTSVKDVYAIGDVNGRYMLAHAAYKEAENTIRYISEEKKIHLDYKNTIPNIMYCNPEVAWVGISEQECMRKSIKYDSKMCSMNYSSRFMIENERENGICKILFSKDDRRIIGCHMVGNGASEIIVSIVSMMTRGETVDGLKDLVFPHPSISEAMHYLTVDL